MVSLVENVQKTDLVSFYLRALGQTRVFEGGATRRQIEIVSFKLRNNDGYPFGSPIRQDYPLNLSILLSGGKETNKDSLSKGD